jgi:hypothetical protein
MAKRRQTLKIRIPPYVFPRNRWREAIHAEFVRVAERQQVEYSSTDQLEIVVTLYLDEKSIVLHDVDNRLKDIMDALQGRAGGPKGERRLAAVVPNDHQIHRAVVEKKIGPWQSHGMGHVIIRKYRDAVSRSEGAPRTRNVQGRPVSKRQLAAASPRTSALALQSAARRRRGG